MQYRQDRRWTLCLIDVEDATSVDDLCHVAKNCSRRRAAVYNRSKVAFEGMEANMKRITTISGRLKQALALILLLPATALSVGNLGRSAYADTAFPQTGYSIWGPFEEYWKAHGGLEQFGMPRTSVYPAGPNYDAQWFERAVFTYDPSKPDPYKVELNLLGSMITESRRAEAPFKAAQPTSDGIFFEPTMHNLSGKFLEYWQATGGLAIYGYPVSEAFSEKSRSDGKNYLVQYFERNRLELHPEAAGTRWEVQLGLLGSELLDANGGPQAIAALGSGRFYPRQVGGIYVPPGDLVDSPNAGTPEPVDNTIPDAPNLPATNRNVLLSASFTSNSDLNVWQATPAFTPPDTSAAAWSIKDGKLYQSGMAGENDASSDALLLTKDASASDVTLESQVYPGGGESLGLVLRWGPGGYYVVKLFATGPNNQPKAHIVKITPTGQKVIGQSTSWPGYTSRQWRAVSFSAKGTSLWVEVDGVKIVEATDSELTSGKYGFYAYADRTAYFDNARATLP